MKPRRDSGGIRGAALGAALAVASGVVWSACRPPSPDASGAHAGASARHGGATAGTAATGAGAAVDYDAAARSVRELLVALVAQDTSNPPGNEARAVTLGAARLEAAGIAYEVTEFAPGRQNLVARLAGDGSERPLLLLAHTDVVGAEGQTWSSDPHAVTERDGFLVGRGVSDDLAMAAIALEVLTMVRHSGATLRRDVVLAWTGDEESGGAGIRWLLANRRASIDAELALNEGGGPILGGEDGGVRWINLQTAEKTYQDYQVIARGPTGHSSVPLADNAIYRLARGLAHLERLRFPARLLPVTRAYLLTRAEIEPAALGAAMRAVASASGTLPAAALAVLDRDPTMAATLRTTCVTTQVHGGTRQNALPAEAAANVNCRLLPDESVEGVRRTLAAALADPALEVRPTEEFGHAEPSPLAGPGPAAIRAVAGRMWPGAPLVPFMSRGATDSRYLRAAGIAAYGLSALAVTEADARRAHGVDERIPVASVRSGVEFFHRLVLELAARRP